MVERLAERRPALALENPFILNYRPRPAAKPVDRVGIDPNR
jgi:hypothetical protein